MSKVIAITGAGIGLGRALARRLANDGERVVLLGRTFAKVQAAAAEIGERAMPVECDVASPSSVKAAFAEIARRHERIDVLINNAAVYEPFLIAEASDEQIMNTLAINLGGAILCSRAAIPLMSRGSQIINVSSEAVETLHLPQMILYQCSKAGLERFTLGLHRELEPSGIRVSSVRAGAMMEAGKVWNIDPAARMRFGKAAMEAGINLLERPLSQFTSVTQVFRSLIDLPDDLHAVSVSLHARKPG
ncbi:MAG TPA: SDR family oxidoreductase [Polyangiales bacterium]|nr:SDR family oxidoreductase [Polyangiales bacterium]